jgi:hypothetical protein
MAPPIPLPPGPPPRAVLLANVLVLIVTVPKSGWSMAPPSAKPPAAEVASLPVKEQPVIEAWIGSRWPRPSPR